MGGRGDPQPSHVAKCSLSLPRLHSLVLCKQNSWRRTKETYGRVETFPKGKGMHLAVIWERKKPHNLHRMQSMPPGCTSISRGHLSRIGASMLQPYVFFKLPTPVHLVAMFILSNLLFANALACILRIERKILRCAVHVVCTMVFTPNYNLLPFTDALR